MRRESRTDGNDAGVTAIYVLGDAPSVKVGDIAGSMRMEDRR